MRPELLPMLLHETKEYPTGVQHGWVMEPKLDGWRFLFEKTAGGEIRSYAGRNGSNRTGQPAAIERELATFLLSGTIVDAEVVVRGNGGVSTDVATVLAHPRAGKLTAYVFDVIQLAGQDMRGMILEDRRERLLDMLHGNQSPDVQAMPYVDPSREFYRDWLELGFEGVVFKRLDSRYRSGIRSHDWLKLKPQQTLEARVVGFKPGESSFAGMVGAVEFEILESGVRSRASGMTMHVRQDMTDHPERWLGSVIEVRHHGISKDGKPRHPQFMRIRPDRDDPEPAPPSQPPRRTVTTEGKPRLRNYKQMLDDKLLRSIGELERQDGEAYAKVINKDGDLDAELAEARRVARERDLA